MSEAEKGLPVLEFRRISPALSDALADFFAQIKSNGDDQNFHPHPFNREQAQAISHYNGQDLYYALLTDDTVIGYGMLRGWDEGFETPSLGIAVALKWRGIGIGNALMSLLHLAARFRGAKRIRLKVYKNNSAAIALYRSLGYEFPSDDGDQWIGFLNL
jgi:[ribosomal protein S18]-alanine N-acetyltransferase